MKRVYTRAELTGAHCGLCGSHVKKHADDCPFADTGVTGVALVKIRPGVVLRFWQCRWWWRGPSGMEYHIEKLPECVGWPYGRYQMSDSPGNTIVTRRRLSDIRRWIGLNQGKL